MQRKAATLVLGVFALVLMVWWPLTATSRAAFLVDPSLTGSGTLELEASGGAGNKELFSQAEFRQRYKLDLDTFILDSRLLRLNADSEFFMALSRNGTRWQNVNSGFSLEVLPKEPWGGTVGWRLGTSQAQTGAERAGSQLTEQLAIGTRLGFAMLPITADYSSQRVRSTEGAEPQDTIARTFQVETARNLGRDAEFSASAKTYSFRDSMNERRSGAYREFRLHSTSRYIYDLVQLSNSLYAFQRLLPDPGLTLRDEASLSISHSRTLESAYRYEMQKSWQESTAVSLDHGQGEIRKTIGKGLNTTLRVDAQRSTSGQTTQIGGAVSGTAGYAARLGGFTLTGNYLASARGTRYDRLNVQMSVVDELHNMVGFEHVTLSNLNVVEESVVVTDQTGLKKYERDRDYEVGRSGASTWISRTPGGEIPDGGVVAVDYSFRVVSRETADLDHTASLGVDRALTKDLTVRGDLRFDQRRLSESNDGGAARITPWQSLDGRIQTVFNRGPYGILADLSAGAGGTRGTVQAWAAWRFATLEAVASKAGGAEQVTAKTGFGINPTDETYVGGQAKGSLVRRQAKVESLSGDVTLRGQYLITPSALFETVGEYTIGSRDEGLTHGFAGSAGLTWRQGLLDFFGGYEWKRSWKSGELPVDSNRLTIKVTRYF